MSSYRRASRSASSFSLFARSMMQDESLPLCEVVQEELFEQACEQFELDFGAQDDAVYTPALVLWALVSQVLFSGEQRSCAAAVTRIASWWAVQGRLVGDTNTGAYCRARSKIPFELVRHLCRTVAGRVEASVAQQEPLDAEQAEAMQTPDTLAEVQSTKTAGRMILVDGFTIDAADTPANQAEFPQNPAQAPGIGFPILRCVSLISMSTGMLLDLAIAPYSGKETGETALLLQMLDSLQAGDVLVADSYYCTYWLLAMCQSRGVQVVMKNHHKREDHPATARRISKDQRVVTWKRPSRPDWMSKEEYAAIVPEMEIRLVDVRVDQPGFRTEGFTVATTILDHRLYTRQWIASVYRSRWLVELDIRAIKCNLGMEHLRAKSPPMVRTELWSCLLAYNLIRMKMLQSGMGAARSVRSMSFTRTLTLLATNWLMCAATGLNETQVRFAQQQPLDEVVGHRPDRCEPRANKRRPKVLALMTLPRAQFKAQLAVAA